MRKNLFPAVIATAVVGLAAAAPAPSAKAPAGAVFRTCPNIPTLVRAQCGSVRVPLDRAHPDRGTIKVAFALVRRLDSKRPSLGTLVPNPGGPGVSTIDSPEASFVQDFAPLLDRRDLLLVDPRGTGLSGRLACKALAGPSIGFASRQDGVRRVGVCGRELGNRAALYGSAAVADDIEAVRAALRLQRLDLWGDSYGTFLMPIYAARHPQHVRSLVLNGAGPVNFDPWSRDRLIAAKRAVTLVCARSHACNGTAVLRDVAKLAAQLRRQPVAFTIAAGNRLVHAKLDEGALAALLLNTSAGADAGLYGRIPSAVADGLAGDLATLRRLVENQLLGSAAIYGNPQTAAFFSLALNVATNCHDYPRVFSYADPPAVRRASYRRALAALDSRTFWPFSPAAWTANDVTSPCIEWPNDPTAGSPLPRGTTLPDVPVLVLSGDLDSNAPSGAGRRAAAQFRHATFVEIPNAGHTPVSQSACAATVGLRFVATLKADPHACVGTGTPPPVAPRAPRRAADVALVRAANATPGERRALGLVVATAADLEQQGSTVDAWGVARGLRGGRYVFTDRGTVRLLGVRVVRDARVSGTLAIVRKGLEGTLRLAGPGVPDGRLRVRVAADGGGRATGVLDGRSVDLVFR